MNRQSEQLAGKLFKGRPRSLKLYRLVSGFIHSLGPVEVVPRKTQVGFKHKRMFAWIWLPQIWIKKQAADSITLAFGLRHRVSDRRIKQSVEPYPGRFTHHVVIVAASGFDPTVRAWLREAYDVAGQVRRQ